MALGLTWRKGCTRQCGTPSALPTAITVPNDVYTGYDVDAARSKKSISSVEESNEINPTIIHGSSNLHSVLVAETKNGERKKPLYHTIPRFLFAERDVPKETKTMWS